MNRSISIAVCASVAAHVLLLALPARQADSELHSMLTVLSVRMGGLQDIQPTAEPPSAAAPTPPAQHSAAESREAAVEAPAPVAAQQSPPAPMQHANQLPAPQAAVAAIEVAEPIPTASPEQPTRQPDALSTEAWSGRVVADPPPQALAPALQTEPIPRRQEKMLNRKLRKWADTLHKLDMSDGGVTWRHRGQEFTARFHPTSSDDTGIEQVLIEISTVVDGRELTTQMRMRRLAFSNFAQFVDRWNPNVQIHDDELDGRFHSNSEISLEFSRYVAPTFRGKVTTASRSVNVAGSGGSMRRADMFLGGLETGVRRIRLPKHYVPVVAGADIDERQVHYFEGDTRIVFRDDGSYGWGPVDDASPQNSRRIPPSTTYLVAREDGQLRVSGVVDGKVLVYSPARVVIEGDLQYARDPRTASDSDDYLGLVSDRRVEIADPEVTGPGDLSVFASIYAKRLFAVRRYREKAKALLYVYGSVAAGSITATEPRFRTRIEFDPRLEGLRAPGFPMTNRYELMSWDRQWQVAPAAFVPY